MAMSATVGRARRSKSAYATFIVTVWVPAWNTIRSFGPIDVDRHVIQVPERRHGPGLAIGEGGGELSLGGQPGLLTEDLGDLGDVDHR